MLEFLFILFCLILFIIFLQAQHICLFLLKQKANLFRLIHPNAHTDAYLIKEVIKTNSADHDSKYRAYALYSYKVNGKSYKAKLYLKFQQYTPTKCLVWYNPRFPFIYASDKIYS